MHESAYSTIPNSKPSTKAFADAEMTFRSTCVEIKIYDAFVRVVLHATPPDAPVELHTAFDRHRRPDLARNFLLERAFDARRGSRGRVRI